MLYYRDLGENLFLPSSLPLNTSALIPEGPQRSQTHTPTLPPPAGERAGGVGEEESMNSLASSLQADLATLNIKIVHISKRITLEISSSLFLSSYFLHFSFPRLSNTALQCAGVLEFAPAHSESAALRSLLTVAPRLSPPSLRSPSARAGTRLPQAPDCGARLPAVGRGVGQDGMGEGQRGE